MAGLFYPASPDVLDATVRGLLDDARAASLHGGAEAEPHAMLPKAIVTPHAGYVYSGPVAASAFALLLPFAQQIRRIVLVGPAHRVYLDGLASPGVDYLATPLGRVAVDSNALATVASVAARPDAHRREHSLEVELPFLQLVAPEALVVPLVVGRATAEEVGAVLEALWGGSETVIVVSSDLSHHLPYDVGRARDRHTCGRIVALETSLEGEEACGSAGLNGLAWVARRKGLRCELVDLKSSGDTAGGRSEVVGYGAFAFYEGEGAS